MSFAPAPAARLLPFSSPIISLGLIAGTALLGPLVLRAPWAAFGAVAAAALVIAAFLHPPVAGYVIVGLVPLMAGMNRGAIFPVLRPSEIVVVVVGGALATRGVLAYVNGDRPRLRMRTTDAAILFLAVAGSVLPILWLAARGQPLTEDDLLYSVQVAKFACIYLIVRASIRTEGQVARCLVISMVVGMVVAVVGILQALKLFGVPELLAAQFQPTDEGLLAINRASSTLGHSFAMADLMVFNLTIAAACLLRGARQPGLLAAAALVFVMGTLASGEFSGAIGLVVGVAALGWVTGRLGRVTLATVPVFVAALMILQPVVQARLSGFSSPSGLPDSWVGRLENLQNYVWPRLFSNFNWVLGVRPSARVHQSGPFSPFHYIESGYTWLLWVGGVPLLLAFVGFLWANVRATKRIAKGRDDAVGVAAIAAFVALVVLAVLTTLDPHMTLRGSGDVLFALVALAYAGSRDESTLDPPRPAYEALGTGSAR